MSEQQHDAPHHDDVRHEKSDVEIRGIVWFGVSLVGLGIVTWLSMTWVYHGLMSSETEAKKSRFPLAAEERKNGPLLPVEPRLEEVNRTVGKDAKKRIIASTREDLKKWPIHEAMSKVVTTIKSREKEARFERPPTDATGGQGIGRRN